MTWLEIKIASLQKMFAIDGDTIEISDTVSPYLKAMPAAANEALLLLSTCGCYIKKSTEIPSGSYEFDMSSVPDFYMLSGEEYVYGENGRRQSVNLPAENGTILQLDGDSAYRVYYYAYPGKITADTADEYELPMSSEAATIIPLYIASELYKDDDISMATVYRNEFEAARAELIEAFRKKQSNYGRERFECHSGWL